MVWKTLVAWLLLIAVAFARMPQTVEIRAGRSGGSGVICGGSEDGNFRIVLTVQHVVGDAGGKCYVHIPGTNFRYQGTVVGADRRSDAAMVLIRGHRGPITDIADARLYLGQIHKTTQVRTEGMAYFGYHESVGNVLSQVGSKVWWNTGSHSGQSGGPSYVLGEDGPVFLTCTTATDGARSVGPYRTFLYEWIPTCTSSDYQYGMTAEGSVRVTPRRSVPSRGSGTLIEDAIAQGPRPKIDPTAGST